MASTPTKWNILLLVKRVSLLKMHHPNDSYQFPLLQCNDEWIKLVLFAKHNEAIGAKVEVTIFTFHSIIFWVHIIEWQKAFWEEILWETR